MSPKTTPSAATATADVPALRLASAATRRSSPLMRDRRARGLIQALSRGSLLTAGGSGTRSGRPVRDRARLSVEARTGHTLAALRLQASVATPTPSTEMRQEADACPTE